MDKNKLAFMLFLSLVIFLMPLINITNVNAFSSEQEFYNYLDSQGIPVTNSNDSSANWNTYQTYNLVVYGNKHGDVRYSQETGRDEYRYLGYTLTGEDYTNSYFPPDATGSKTPEEWNYIEVDGAKDTWRNLNEDVEKHMTTATLTGNGASADWFNVSYINGGNGYKKTKLLSIASWKNGFSVYTQHKTSSGKVYYATFNGEPMAAGADVTGKFTLDKTTYTITRNEDEVTIPVKFTAEAILNGMAKVDHIETIEATFAGKSNSGSKQTSVSVTKDYVISRSNYDAGTHTVTLKGTAYLKSSLDANDVYTKNITKEITLVVEEKTEPYVTVNAEIDPSTYDSLNSDVPVQITVTGEINNLDDLNKIKEWKLYAKEKDSEIFQENIISSTNGSETATFNFTIPAGTESQTYKTTAIVVLTNGKSYQASTEVSSTFIETEPPPPPPPNNEPPTVELFSKSSVRAGENLYVSALGEDPEGSPLTYYWTTPGANGTIEGQSGTIWYPASEVGSNIIHVAVDDGNGGFGGDSKTITVTEPIPEAKITYSGALKVNRKVTLSARNSSNPEHYPIDWSLTKWEITPLTTGITQTDIKSLEPTFNGLSQFDVLFKKAGDYKIRLTITNEAGYSDTVEQIYKIEPDLPPVADYSFVTKVYRDPDNYNHATFKLTNLSYSKDGDLIDNLRVYYRYDSDNDGDFFDEEIVEVYNGPNKEIIEIEVSEVGKYLIDIEVTEKFGQETIPEFISPGDYKKGSTAY